MFELYRSRTKVSRNPIAGSIITWQERACQDREYRLWLRHRSPESLSEGTSCARHVRGHVTASRPVGL